MQCLIELQILLGSVWFCDFSAALKPDQFQGQAGKSVDTEDSRVNIVSAINSANSVFSGEDKNKNGVADKREGKDVAHNKPLRSGGTNKDGYRISSRSKNRSNNGQKPRKRRT